MQVHEPVLTPAGSGSGHQPIAPQQYFLMGGVPGAKLHHVLGTGTGGKYHTGKSLIGGSLNQLRRVRRANNSDSVAKGTGGTCNIEQHDLAAAYITIIGCNIQFLRHDLEPFCLNLPSNPWCARCRWGKKRCFLCERNTSVNPVFIPRLLMNGTRRP